MDIRIRGISYHLEFHQQKEKLPTMVLLHGFLGSGDSFKPLIPLLAEFSNPVTIDLLGHGKTQGAELHYRFSTKEQVADIVKLISEQLQTPLFLYGYSMGARLALQTALHRPDLFQGLLLESGTFGIEGETERQVRQSLDGTRSDAIMGNFEDFLKEWDKKPLFTTNTPTAQTEFYSEIQAGQNPLWMANSLLGFGTGTMPCVRDRLTDLNTPVQLIAGERDSKFIRINQTMNKDLPESNLSIVERSGHRVHLEQPEDLAQIIQHFIATHKLPDIE
ncbi:MAG TPA: 2-succinyl-6-hydroxy-2,4-cyclohexadiene-1-carboxylate synthase [Balneolaceae bacterium]|nr:2-succinyl-6-hydroxy-2,4-cyclohexadiene-1-carboxylate synthase [Balneolaceae bacterium]|tara:strand:+ start:106967 stop:107794 length:828 start_codon:yes stop_codon:yes gene_type:complete